MTTLPVLPMPPIRRPETPWLLLDVIVLSLTVIVTSLAPLFEFLASIPVEALLAFDTSGV